MIAMAFQHFYTIEFYVMSTEMFYIGIYSAFSPGMTFTNLGLILQDSWQQSKLLVFIKRSRNLNGVSMVLASSLALATKLNTAKHYFVLILEKLNCSTREFRVFCIKIKQEFYKVS